MRRAVLAVLAALAVAGCASPEARRTRGGGPGADIGNRSRVVDLHEGADPFYKTPRLIDSRFTVSASAKREDRGNR
jgi:hypothetical protein